MAIRHPPYTIEIMRFGEQPVTHSRTELTCPPADAYRALQAVRAGLPPNFGASLTDRFGYNVRASDTKAEG